MDCLVGLSSLSHCVVLEITQSQLRGTNKVKNFLTKYEKPHQNFTIESLISSKNTRKKVGGNDILQFYKKIKVSYFTVVFVDQRPLISKKRVWYDSVTSK